MSTARYSPSFATTPRAAPSTGKRGLAWLVAGVAVLSALTVFLLLCERDHTLLLATSSHTVMQAAATEHTPAVSAPPAADDITRVTVPTAAETQPSTQTETAAHAPKRPIEFTLTRSRRFQQVGPMFVGLWKIDTKHKLYDVSLVADGRRVDRKRVALNSPVLIPSGETGRQLQLVVNSLSRGSVSGYVSEPPANH